MSEPQAEDEEVPGEEDGEETEVVDAEPLVGALGGDGGGRREDGGHESGGDGGDGLHHLGLVGGREGRLHNIGCGGVERRKVTREHIIAIATEGKN